MKGKPSPPSDTPSFVGAAMIDWMWHITTPLARLSMGSEGAVIEPSARLLRWFLPRKVIRWSDVTKAARTRNGVRFYIVGEGGSTGFYGGNPERILDQIEAYGVPVDRSLHRSGWWGGD